MVSLTRTRARPYGARSLVLMVAALALTGAACASANLPDRPDAAGTPSTADTPRGAPGPSPDTPPEQDAGPADHDTSSATDTGPTSNAEPRGRDAATPTASSSDADPGGPRAEPTEATYGPGVTDEQITIGLHVSEPVDEAIVAFGGQTQSQEREDEIRIAQAVIDDLNAHGGIAGRQVVPVFHRTDQLNGTFASQAQAACATFTEDNTVFTASSSVINATDQLLACLRDRGVPMVDLSLWPYDQPYYDEAHGLLYQPGRMRGGRATRTYVDGLVESGFFDRPDGPPKFALLRFDAPVFERLSDEHLKPQLATHGLQLTDEIVFSTPQQATDAGMLATQSGNAIVRLRSQDVTHILMLEVTGALPFVFTQEAESQGYRPTYGFSTNNLLVFQTDQDPPEQLVGAKAVGWNPPIDVYEEQHTDPSAPLSRCLGIMRDSGQSTYGLYGPNHCDHLWFLKSALERAPALTRAGLLAGVEQLGDSYLSAMTSASTFGPGRYDGADAYRLIAYDRECDCWRHTTPPRPARH